jgi:type II secretory pathway pseudopilin PulG
MTRSGKTRQSGMTFIGLLFVAGLVAVTVAVGMQVVPTYTEFRTIQKAVNKAAAEGETVPAVRAVFDRAADIDYISSITGKDLEVTKVNDKVVVNFAYEREIHLTGPAYLTLKYSGRSK